MKKFFTAALIAVTLTTSAFASDVNKVSDKTVAHFNREFENAQDVSWSVKPTFVKASFLRENQRVEAFYDYQGQLIGCSHAIGLDNLPTSAKRAFAKKYADYTVKEAIQFDGIEATEYYISAENEKQSVVLRVANGFLSVYKKTIKD
jgi:hypothetical protein